MDELKKVRFGVIGAGWFACRRHLPDIQREAGAELAAICRRDPESRATIAAQFGLAERQCFADWQEMLAEVELDAVLIATPPALHYAQAKAALERGLHVLLEKPMTVRGAEAWELVALAEKQGLQLSVALNPPFWARSHQMREALTGGELGELESASLYWTGSAEYVFGRAEKPDNLPGIVPPTMYRSDPELGGGGYFVDGGSHLVSDLIWTTGLRARRVSALMDTTPTDMRTVVSLEMENGAIASITSIGDSKFPERRVSTTLGAKNGTITVNTFAFETEIKPHGQPSRSFKEADLPPVSGPVANFVKALNGQEDLFSPGTHGAHVVEIVEAACHSAVTGNTITL
jgi:predicted dehydrogenase